MEILATLGTIYGMDPKTQNEGLQKAIKEMNWLYER